MRKCYNDWLASWHGLLGWPSLACHKLTLLGDEITELETTLGLLLAAVIALDKPLCVAELTSEVEVNNK